MLHGLFSRGHFGVKPAQHPVFVCTVVKRTEKRILLIMIIAITFAGCATDSDPDRLSWDDAKKQLASVFGEDNSSMAQAKEQMQGLNEDQCLASQNYLKK